MTIPPDERSDFLAAVKANYIAGDIGITRCEAQLVMAGMNATEIRDFIIEHREAALKAFQERTAARLNLATRNPRK